MTSRLAEDVAKTRLDQKTVDRTGGATSGSFKRLDCSHILSVLFGQTNFPIFSNKLLLSISFYIPYSFKVLKVFLNSI